MASPTHLTSHPFFESRDPEECAAHMSDRWRHLKYEVGRAKDYYVRQHTAQLQICAISTAYARSPQRVQIESDPRFYFLVLGLTGRADYVINGRKFSFGAGEGLLSLPTEQVIQHSADFEVAIVAIPAASFDREAESLIGYSPKEPLEVLDIIRPDSPILRKIRHSLEELSDPKGLFDASAAAGLNWQHMLIAAIIEATPNSWAPLLQVDEHDHNSPFHRRKRCRIAEDFMEAHMGDVIHIAQIAKEVGCSKRTLQEDFAYSWNAPPMKIFRDKRVAAAVTDLMNDPTATIPSVARKYNFGNEGRFAKYFKDMVGCKPSEFQRDVRTKPRE
jgi:AraC-like DNA-binding protein